MSAKSKETYFRIAGMAGLVLLLGFVLLSGRGGGDKVPAKEHDHADPAAHGKSTAGKTLDKATARKLI